MDDKYYLVETIPDTYFDKDKIQQVIINLVNNAIKFTEVGAITISTAINDNMVFVSIEDTGMGISDDGIHKLFQNYQQLDVDPSKKAEGSGLGLAICKEIVEQHEGTIWCASTPGKGSRFQFILPMRVIKDGGYDK